MGATIGAGTIPANAFGCKAFSKAFWCALCAKSGDGRHFAVDSGVGTVRQGGFGLTRQGIRLPVRRQNLTLTVDSTGTANGPRVNTTDGAVWNQTTKRQDRKAVRSGRLGRQ